MPTTSAEPPISKPSYSSQYSHSYPTLPIQANAPQGSAASFPQAVTTAHPRNESRPFSVATINAKYSQMSSQDMSADSSLFLGMNSSYTESSSRPTAASQASFNQGLPSPKIEGPPHHFPYGTSTAMTEQQSDSGHTHRRGNELHHSMNPHSDGVMIESHDVDMNTLQHQELFPFSSDEILPWLEYLPQDVLSFFGENQNFAFMSPDDATPGPHH